MPVGTYQEELSCGGTLKVHKNSWEISYYFAGVDLRYNGTFVSIPGSSINDYILAFKENWEDYEQLKSAIPSGGEFTKDGKLGMSIRIGRFKEGVCLRSYHMPISSKKQLESIIKTYKYASERAPQIQKFLAAL
ncbi:hypothetical protein [Acinetobacter kanungonis]|uniref:hypothetical protein n=1 Tax=Acinetobacter kanungonis TaxID=2699469 RepID=UPI00137AF1CA|nr:hypothetical protein [Acinetobacter kanungonis]NCI77290.1 hypothetical protein [Acinetobacter kanungonis]